jgi:hypothetical protein
MSKITPTIHITHGKKANHIPIVGPKGSQPQSHMRDINSLMTPLTNNYPREGYYDYTHHCRCVLPRLLIGG